MASKELLAELHRLQHMLDGTPSSYSTGACAAESDESEADASIQEGIAAALRAQLAQTQAEASALKQQLAMAEQEVEEVRTAASSARREAESMAAALGTQLAARAREVDELAGALAAERQEAQALHEALDKQRAGEAAAVKEAALMHAAEEERWQVQQTQVAVALAAAREEAAALRSTNRELRAQLEAVQAALEEERAEHSHIQLRQAVMAVAAKSPRHNAEIAALKSRVSLERKWRKATHAWLAGEAHAKSELERLMLNLSAAITAGPLPSGSPRCLQAPVLPPRRVTAATMQPPPTAAEWRSQLAAAMQAFEQRSQALTAELSRVRLHMEAMAAQ